MIRSLRAWRRFPNLAARPGQALVIAAMSFTALLMLTALAVDIGNLTLQQRKLRQLAEGAALSAAQIVFEGAGGRAEGTPAHLQPGSFDAAKTYLQVLAEYSCEGGDPDCQIEHPVAAYGTDGDQYIRVTLFRDIPFAFARIFGLPSQRISATATARGVRPLFSSAAVIALGPGGVQVSGTGAYVVRGDVAATSGSITISGASLDIRDGFGAFANNAIAPGPVITGGSFPGDLDARRRFPDPIDLAVRTGQLVLPTFPAAPGSCGLPGNDPAPYQLKADALTGAIVPPTSFTVSGGSQRVRILGDIDEPGVSASGSPTLTVTLNPGQYCSIDIIGDNESDVVVTFRPGNYTILQDITINGMDVGSDITVTLGTGTYRMRSMDVDANSTSNVDVELGDNSSFFLQGDLSVAGPAYLFSNPDASEGIFIHSRGRVEFGDAGASSADPIVELRGRRAYNDIIIYVDTNGSGDEIAVRDVFPGSVILGTLYAPSGGIAVWGRGCSSVINNAQYRVRRTPSTGSGGPTAQGGRVIAQQVTLRTADSASNSCGVSYFPDDSDPDFASHDYMIAPSLVPNAP